MKYLLALAFLALPVAASLEQPRTTPPNLPPLPDSIPSQLGWVQVERVPNLVCGVVEALGCYNGNENRVQVRAGLPLAVAWHALEHEKVHMVLWLSGQYIGGEREDRIADAIGAARVTELLAR